MARVRCWIEDCRFWKGGTCSSPEIEIDPDEGCLTMEVKQLEEDEEEWEDEEGLEEDEEWEEDEE